MKHIIVGLLALTVIALLRTAPASADWSREQRGQFTADCVQSCQANPKVDASRRAECGAYCGCVMGEAEKFMTSADYDSLDALVKADKTSPMLERFRKIPPVCNRRIFGQ